MQSSKKLSMKNALRKVLTSKIKTNTLKKESNYLSRAKRLSLKDVMVQTTYLESLREPEYSIGAKVPHQLSKETISLSRHITNTINVNTSGNAAILFSPFYLKDDLTALTTLYVNNAVGYDGVSAFGTGYQALAIPMQVPANNVSAYRLVSASFHIVPQMPLTTSVGKIGMAVTDFLIAPAAPASSTLLYNSAATISYIESLRPYAEADCCVPESIRGCWFPYDNNDLCLYDINLPQDTSVTAERENVFMAYITGAPSLARFNIELFWNFEVTPYPGSIISGMGTFATENADPISVTRVFKSQPQSIINSYVTTQHNHVSDGRNFTLSTGNPDTVINSRGKVINIKGPMINGKQHMYG